MEIINIVKALNFTSFVWMITLPTAMMAFDVVTGLMKAWATKDFQSAKMRSGLAKKTGELVIILMGIVFVQGMGMPTYVLNFMVLYIILMELMSVVENLDQLGVPLPQFVKDAINNIGSAIQHDDIDELNKKINSLQATINQLQGKQ